MVIETVYSLDENIREKVEESFRDILIIAQMHHIPLYATAAVANINTGTEYNSIVYNAASHGIVLTDDQIRVHMLVAAGFDVTPPRDVVTFDPLGVLDSGQKVNTSVYSVPEDARELFMDKTKKLFEFCEIYHIPMFVTAAMENNEKMTVYDSVVYNARSHDIELADDRIRRHMLVADGFCAVPPKQGEQYVTAEEAALNG